MQIFGGDIVTNCSDITLEWGGNVAPQVHFFSERTKKRDTCCHFRYFFIHQNVFVSTGTFNEADQIQIRWAANQRDRHASGVRNGRWRHYWCVPAADGRSDLTRQSSPSFPSQHNRCNATGCFFFATIVPVKPSAGVAISLLHITAVQYYSYSLFLFFFCIESASGLSEFRSQLSRLYCEKCWGLPSLKKWQTVRVDDHIFTNLSSDQSSANLFPW